MKFEQPIICVFCIKDISPKISLRFPKALRQMEDRLMREHKPNCVLWNDLAFVIRNRDV